MTAQDRLATWYRNYAAKTSYFHEDDLEDVIEEAQEEAMAAFEKELLSGEIDSIDVLDYAHDFLMSKEAKEREARERHEGNMYDEWKDRQMDEAADRRAEES